MCYFFFKSTYKSNCSKNGILRSLLKKNESEFLMEKRSKKLTNFKEKLQWIFKWTTIKTLLCDSFLWVKNGFWFQYLLSAIVDICRFHFSITTLLLIWFSGQLSQLEKMRSVSSNIITTESFRCSVVDHTFCCCGFYVNK